MIYNYCFYILLSSLFFCGCNAKQANAKELHSEVTPDKELEFIDVASTFLGRPYVASTLEGNNPERLVINTEEVDCTTFVEYTTAALLSNQMPDSINDGFRDMLRNIRYRDGKIDGYASRLHYFSEWIDNNQKRGYITEITDSFNNEQLPSKAGYMSKYPDKYPELKKNPSLVPIIKESENYINSLDMRYIPKDKLAGQTGLIREGDIIAITTDIPGLEISHVGFAVIKDGEVYLMHASTGKKMVIIDPKPLTEYLNSNPKQTGIRVIRINR